MIEKLKKLDFKHILLVFVLTLFIGLLVLCFVLLNNLDKNNYKKNFYSSDISYVDDNLYKNDYDYVSYNNAEFAKLPYIIHYDFDNFSRISGVRYDEINGVDFDVYQFNYDSLYWNSYYLTFSLSYYFEFSSDDEFSLPYYCIYSDVFLSSNDLMTKVYNDEGLSYISLSTQEEILTSIIFMNTFLQQYNYVYFCFFGFDLTSNNTLYFCDTPSLNNACYIYNDYLSSYNYAFNLGRSSSGTTNYNIGFSDGVASVQDEYNTLNTNYEFLQTQYNSLDTNYNTLLEQYNALASGEYTFSELFWSISAVPFGVLTSAFNVDVLGVDLRGIITGLFTALLIIWLIKKLF